MRLTMIVAVIFVILLIGTIIIPFVKGVTAKGNKPFKTSWLALVFLIANWVAFLTGVYTLLPVKLADQLFVAIWFVLCAFAFICSGVEFKNNKYFALPIAGLSTISLLFSILAMGIGKM